MLGNGPKVYSKTPNKRRKSKVKWRERERERGKIGFVDVRFENTQVAALEPLPSRRGR